MSATPLPTLPVVVASGRTLSVSGIVYINDSRPRTSGAFFTFTQIVDGVQYDIYAKAEAGNQYSLLALTYGSDVSGRTDVLFLGVATDYPSLFRTEWQPAVGGALDNYVNIDTSGGMALGASLGTSKAHIDRYGRINSVAQTTPTVVTGAGSGQSPPGTFASYLVQGSDQWGVVYIYVQTGVAPQSNALLFRMTFSKPYVNTPYGVMLDIVTVPMTNTEYTDMIRQMYPNVTNTYWEIVAPIGYALPNRVQTYGFKYIILGAD